MLLEIVLPLRVLASRAVLVLGFDTSQLRELPYPLDKEMDDYGRLQGTYRVKSTNYEIELTSTDTAPANEAMHLKSQIASHTGGHFGVQVSEGQNIVVSRLTKEEWSVKHGYNLMRDSRFKIVNKKSIAKIGGTMDWVVLREFCYPESGRLERAQIWLQDSLKVDEQGSLVWTVKATGKTMAVTWTCQTYRLRRSSRKS